jgi:CRISPR type IV-associated protein Csf3
MGLTYEPLHITARLRTGVVCERALPLDGILLYQAMRHAYGPQDARLPGITLKRTEDAPVPLLIIDAGTPGWYYACSFAVWPDHTAEGKSYWEKRIDAGRMDIVDLGKTRKINIGKGEYRSYHMPIFYLSALRVEWYAVGNALEIERLLRDVWAIGKKTAQGWGRVIRWEVEPWPEDWSARRNGELMRAIPITGDFDKNRVTLTGFRPPYWLRENQALCQTPRAKI